MKEIDVRLITGLSGVAIGILGTAVVPLYFMYSGAPPAWNVLTRNLLGLISLALLIVFVTGLREVLHQADSRYDWVANLVHSAGLIFVTVRLVAVSLEVGGVLGNPDGTVDPTIHGPLAEGNMLLHGSVTRIVTVVLLAAAGFAILRTRALPTWAGWSAYAIAVVNLAFVPSLYFGKDAAQFYSAVGWGNSALTASFFLYWILACSIAMLRKPRAAAARR
jgi:hypothetical protein